MGAIYLIRHGQASFGADDYDQLSARGQRQAQILGDSLRTRVPAPGPIRCGGMRRHRQTAEHCLQAMQQPYQVEDDAGWAEYDHEAVLRAHRPEWADKARMKADLLRADDPRRAFQDEFRQAMERWCAGNSDNDYPESWLGFRQRIEQALTRLRANLRKSQTALVFTSGGPITAVTQQLLQLSDERALRLNWTLANCGITKLIYSDRDLYLASVNEHACFEGRHADLLTYR